MKTLRLAALLLVGCTPATQQVTPTKPSHTAEHYFQLAPGTSWTYQVKMLGQTDEKEVHIVGPAQDGFVEDSTGAQFLADPYGVRDQKRYLLRNPIEIGTRWTNVVSVSSIENYEILAAGQSCDAPAGTWEDCVVVESRNRLDADHVLINEITFAPGVGIVHVATTMDVKGQALPQASLTLVKFAAAPSPAR